MADKVDSRQERFNRFSANLRGTHGQLSHTWGYKKKANELDPVKLEDIPTKKLANIYKESANATDNIVVPRALIELANYCYFVIEDKNGKEFDQDFFQKARYLINAYEKISTLVTSVETARRELKLAQQKVKVNTTDDGTEIITATAALKAAVKDLNKAWPGQNKKTVETAATELITLAVKALDKPKQATTSPRHPNNQESWYELSEHNKDILEQMLLVVMARAQFLGSEYSTLEFEVFGTVAAPAQRAPLEMRWDGGNKNVRSYFSVGKGAEQLDYKMTPTADGQGMDVVVRVHNKNKVKDALAMVLAKKAFSTDEQGLVLMTHPGETTQQIASMIITAYNVAMTKKHQGKLFVECKQGTSANESSLLDKRKRQAVFDAVEATEGLKDRVHIDSRGYLCLKLTDYPVRVKSNPLFRGGKGVSSPALKVKISAREKFFRFLYGDSSSSTDTLEVALEKVFTAENKGEDNSDRVFAEIRRWLKNEPLLGTCKPPSGRYFTSEGATFGGNGETARSRRCILEVALKGENGNGGLTKGGENSPIAKAAADWLEPVLVAYDKKHPAASSITPGLGRRND